MTVVENCFAKYIKFLSSTSSVGVTLNVGTVGECIGLGHPPQERPIVLIKGNDHLWSCKVRILAANLIL